MRVDKFLWVLRYFKTRNMGTIACKKGHVKVNGDVAKASRNVYITDIIEVRKNQINYKLSITDIPSSRVGAKLVDLYRKDLTPKEEFATREMLKLTRDHYREKGSGRPSKKERRDMDDFYSENE
jgi:ribosome-associated heat shock protein Hsp15